MSSSVTDNYWYLSEIEQAVAASKDADAALLREVAIAYAEACHEVNRRLRAVAEWLDLGLRAEAIELADEGEPLLEVVSKLDFARRETWVELLGQLDLDSPPDLDLNTAAQLNSAYGELEQLAPMLAKHRLLALARAPLPIRINVLRRLIAADDTIPGWREDIEQYESVRLQEIGKELSAAIRARDAPAIDAIAAEVCDHGWTIKPPQDLLDRVRTAQGDFERTAAIARLEELLPQIEAAYGELNAQAMEPLADEWRRLEVVAALSSDDALVERAAPALEWIDQMRAEAAAAKDFDAALAALETVLDHTSDANEVRRAYDAARRFEQPIPELLDSRARNRIASLEGARKRRFVAGLTLVCLAIATVAVGVGLWWSRALYAEQLAQTKASLGELLEANDLAAAESFAGQLDASVAGEPDVAALLTQLEEKLAAEVTRRRRCLETLKLIEAMDAAAPDAALIARAKELVRAADEQQRLNSVQAAITRATERARNERDQRVGEAQQEWSQRIAAARRQLDDSGRLWSAGKRLTADAAAAALLPKAPISAGVRNTSEALVDDVRKLVALDRRRGKQTQLMNEAFSQIGNLEEYRDAWRRFGNEFPEHLAARSAAAEGEAWRRVLAWQEHWAEHGRELSRRKPAEAAEQMTAMNLLLPAEPEADDPCSARARELRGSLLKIQARQEAMAKLRRWLRDPLFDLWVVKMGDGELRYCGREPKRLENGRVRFEYYEDDSRTPTPRSSSDVLWVGRAPHSVLRDRAELLVKEVERGDETWDTGFYVVCRDTLRLMESEPDDDAPAAAPVPTLDLFRRFVVVAGEGSLPFAEACEGYMKQINDAPIDFQTPWFLPRDIRASAAQAEAVRAMPVASEWERRFRAARESFERAYQAPPRVEWIGAIDNTTSPGRLRTSGVDDRTGKLVVALAGRSDWQAIGELAGGTPQCRSLRGLATGTPVFLLQP